MSKLSKETKIDEVLRVIYSSKSKTTLTKNQVKAIEGEFKRYQGNIKASSSVEDFIKSTTPKVKELLERKNNEAVRSEINKQLRENKALQPGVLSECVILRTCAEIFKLKSFIDIGNSPMSELPNTIARFINTGQTALFAARYVYCNKNDTSTFIIQYGNPNSADGAIILHTDEITLEVKNLPALLMDKDLIYDECGKIVKEAELIEKYPTYMKYIDRFNAETSILDTLGSNYRLFQNDSTLREKQELVEMYFKDKPVDLILTSVKDKLIAIRPKDLNFIFKDGSPLIDVSGSEIRPVGKNLKRTIYTPNLFRSVLSDRGIEIIGEVCRVYKDKLPKDFIKNGRGKTTPTRYYLHPLFTVKITPNLSTQMSDKTLTYIDIPIKDIEQKKSGIAVHIDIKKTKEKIKSELYPD